MSSWAVLAYAGAPIGWIPEVLAGCGCLTVPRGGCFTMFSILFQAEIR